MTAILELKQNLRFDTRPEAANRVKARPLTVLRPVLAAAAIAFIAQACTPRLGSTADVEATLRPGITQPADCPPPKLCTQPNNAETPIPKENQELSANIRSLLGLTPNSTLSDFTETGFNLQFSDGAWIYNPLPDGKPFITPENRGLFANFRNTKGTLIGVGMDERGELDFTIPGMPENKAVIFPHVETPIYTRPLIFGDNIIGIYGSREVVDALAAKWQDNPSIRRFLQGYFGGESALATDGKGRKIIHLIFAPQDYGSIALQGGSGVIIDTSDFGGKTFVHIDEKGNFIGTDIIFNLNRLYNGSQTIDSDLRSKLMSIFADERANLTAARRGADLHQLSYDAPHTEAFSSLCGLLAYLDPDMREVLLGALDYNLFNDLVRSLEELARQAKTQSSLPDFEVLQNTTYNVYPPLEDSTGE